MIKVETRFATSVDRLLSFCGHAVNGAGQNKTRALFSGARVAAPSGLSGSPQRFSDGLAEGDEIAEWVQRLWRQDPPRRMKAP